MFLFAVAQCWSCWRKPCVGHKLIVKPLVMAYGRLLSTSKKISHRGCGNWITTLPAASHPLLPQFLQFNWNSPTLEPLYSALIIKFHCRACHHWYSTVLHDGKLIGKVILHCTWKMNWLPREEMEWLKILLIIKVSYKGKN